MSPETSLAVGLLLAALPAGAADGDNGFHSTRHFPAPIVQIIQPEPSTGTAAGGDEASDPVTVETARQNAPGLIEAFLSRKAPDGLFALGKTPVRFESADVSRIREVAHGRFRVPVLMRDEEGRAVNAEASVDLSGDEWTVDGIQRAVPSKSFDAARCFEDAVKKRLKQSSRSGLFLFHVASTAQASRLKLKRVHKESLAAFGQGSYYTCVDFQDMDAGKTVDLDFYATAANGTCAIDQIVLHRIDGKVQTIKPMPLGAQ
jgi:hypothetical protein